MAEIEGEEDRGPALGVPGRHQVRVLAQKGPHTEGIIAHNRGARDEALVLYRKVLDIAKELDDLALMAGSYHQMGNMAFDRGAYERGLDHFRFNGIEVGMTKYGRSPTRQTTAIPIDPEKLADGMLWSDQGCLSLASVLFKLRGVDHEDLIAADAEAASTPAWPPPITTTS